MRIWCKHIGVLFGLVAVSACSNKPNVEFVVQKQMQIKDSLIAHYRAANWKKMFHLTDSLIKQSPQVIDSSLLAEAFEFNAAYYEKQQRNDSAYYYGYRAANVFKALDSNHRRGRALVRLAIIQKNTRDYAGSEQNSYNALKYLDTVNDIRTLATIYNNLGIVYNQLKDTVTSLKFHTKALELRLQIGKRDLVNQSYNNIGKAYKDLGQYELAETYFNEVFKDTSIIRPADRAAVIDNLAHNRFLSGDSTSVYKDMMYALNLRIAIDNQNGMAINYLHLTDYFKRYGEDSLAIEYAKKASISAKSTQNYRDYFRSITQTFSICELSTVYRLHDRYKEGPR